MKKVLILGGWLVAMQAFAVLPMPLPRVLDPSMMGPPVEPSRIDADGTIHNLYWAEQKGINLRLPRATSEWETVVWIKSTNATSWYPLPFLAPQEVKGKATATTFIGPESGTGSKTWSEAIPACVPNTAESVIAFNLTCAADTTLTTDRETRTFSAGTHKGVMMKTSTSGSLTLTTEGTWEIEIATPKSARCYEPLFSSPAQTAYPGIILGNQWGVVFCHGKIENDQIILTYRTYYPDGCRVTYEQTESDTATYAAGAFGLTAFPKGMMLAPYKLFYAGNRIDATLPCVYEAYGCKGWSRALTEAERLAIINKDNAVMLQRGNLADADILHGASTHTYSLRGPRLIHDPGLPPPMPDFEEHTDMSTDDTVDLQNT